MMLPTSESRNNATAKRMWLGITYNQDSYGLVMKTEQLGFSTRLFFPVVKMGTQQETEAFDITPDDTLCLVETRELDAALATFGSQSVTLTVTEQQVCIENEQQSRVVVRTLRNRQLSLPLDVDGAEKPEAHAMACAASRMVDADDVKGFVRLNLQGMVNALLPATKVTTMAGNMGDMKGVHIETLTPASPVMGRSAAADSAVTLRVVGAHEKALFVYEDKAACTCNWHEESSADDSTLRGSSPRPNGRGLGRGSLPVSCIISPDVAKRLRDMLAAEMLDGMDDKGVCHKELWMRNLGGLLEVCCGTWFMCVTALDICGTDCQEYLDQPGKNCLEVERTKLLQALNGLRTMGETEAVLTLGSRAIVIEGEQAAHKGERMLKIPCERIGVEELPERVYAIAPMITMLSAACAAENSRKVKLLADADDKVLCIRCDEYNVFVR